MADANLSTKNAATLATIQTIAARLGNPYVLDGLKARSFSTEKLMPDRGGSDDATSKLTTLLNSAEAGDDPIEIEPAILKTSAEVVIRPGGASVTGSYEKTTIKPVANTYHGVRALGSATGFNYNKRGRRIENLIIEGPAGTPARNGKAACVLDAATRTILRAIRVDGFDIGYDFINNCGNTSCYDLDTNRGLSRLNCALNIREGNQSGSDLNFYNAQLSGVATALSIAGGGGGYRFFGGSIGTTGMAGGTDGADLGVFTFGYDYATATRLQGLGSVIMEGVHSEGWRGRYLIRGYGAISAQIIGFGINPSVSDATEMALGLIDLTQIENSKWLFMGNDIGGGGGHFKNDAARFNGDQGGWTLTDLAWNSAAMNVAGVSRARDWLKSLGEESNYRGGHFQPGFYPMNEPGQGRTTLGFGRNRLNVDQGKTPVLSMDNGATYPALASRTSFYEAGTAMTLGTEHRHAFIRRDNAAANTVVFPAPATAAVGQRASQKIMQQGAGQTELVRASGITLRPSGTTHKISKQGGVVCAEWVGDTEVALYGDLVVA